MNIISIDKLETVNESIIDATLSSGSYNESYYYKYMISVTVTFETDEDYLLLLCYRAFKRSTNQSYWYLDDTKKCQITFSMSLMDCINFIYKATPPLLQNKIKESITSIDNIFEIMKTYLLEDNGDKQLRVGMLLKDNGFYNYNGWSDDNGKTDQLAQLIDTSKINAYLDIECDDFKQYIIIAPINKIKEVHDLVSNISVTHVCVKDTNPMVPKLVYVKVSNHNRDTDTSQLDSICESTLKALENI